MGKQIQQMDEELRRIDAAIHDLMKSLGNDRRHLNELETLGVRVLCIEYHNDYGLRRMLGAVRSV